jgi:hypothetical protein
VEASTTIQAEITYRISGRSASIVDRKTVTNRSGTALSLRAPYCDRIRVNAQDLKAHVEWDTREGKERRPMGCQLVRGAGDSLLEIVPPKPDEHFVIPPYSVRTYEIAYTVDDYAHQSGDIFVITNHYGFITGYDEPATNVVIQKKAIYEVTVPRFKRLKVILFPGPGELPRENKNPIRIVQTFNIGIHQSHYNCIVLVLESGLAIGTQQILKVLWSQIRKKMQLPAAGE